MLITNNPSEVSMRANRKRNYYNYAIPLGFALSADCILLRALKKSNRADSFVKTIKNCARDYTVGNKKDLSLFLGKWVNNVSNKTMLPLIFLAGGLTNGLFINWLIKLFKKD